MPKILNIITNPNPILRKKSEDINEKLIKTDEFKSFCEDMILTMKEKDGIGLAAPQIGKNIKFFVINSKDGPLCMINPELKNKSWIKEWGEEGCLSVPNVFGEVKRHKKLTCFYTNEKGEKKKIEAKGLLARVIQHENDHLNGVLFIDKAKKVKEISND